MKQKISKSQKKDVQQPNAFGNHNQTVFLSCQQNLKFSVGHLILGVISSKNGSLFGALSHIRHTTKSVVEGRG
jgi:hypothetical protein